ncbi:amidohydrolase [Gammaproteobacteria bacterium]|nr:amidohydrolase [Gammaproteobacteria bacterium]
MRVFYFFIILTLTHSVFADTSKKIFLAKDLITLDDRFLDANAFVIQDDKILSVGHLKNLLKIYPEVQIDQTFKDDVIVPGFIEHHIHPLLAAITMNSSIVAIDDWIVPGQVSKGVRERKAYLERLINIESKSGESKNPLISWGFHHYFHGNLDRHDLDLISKERPILIIHRSFHEFILNSKALEFFNISEKDIAHLNEYDRKLADLEKGHFSERGLIAVMPKIMEYLATPERIIKGMQTTEDYIQQNGITLIGNPGSMYDPKIQQVKNYVFGDTDTPFRSFYIPSALYMLENMKIEDLLDETIKHLSWGAGKVQFLPKHIKLFSDGAMYSQNMVLRDGYLDGHQGVWLMEGEVFKQTFQLYWDAGYQIHVHQNGDGGLDRILDVLDENIKRNPRKDHRTTIVHFGYSAKDQIERMKTLGVIVSANPYYVSVLSELYSRKGVGFKRSQQMVRLGDVDAADIPISLHSDMPMAPASPLFLMHSAVNRINYANKVAGPNQRISAITALKGVTLNSAYTMGLEDDYGSISPGKYANFTVLSHNPLTIDPLLIKDIEIKGTAVEGRLFKN